MLRIMGGVANSASRNGVVSAASAAPASVILEGVEDMADAVALALPVAHAGADGQSGLPEALDEPWLFLG